MPSPHSFATRTLALAAGATLALSGCTLTGVDDDPTSAQATKAGKDAQKDKPAAPEKPSSDPAKLDAALAGAQESKLVAAEEKVEATSLRFAKARNLTEATDVIRSRMLREGFYNDAPSTTITSQVIAASDAVVGVQMTAKTTVDGKDATLPATLWYSTAAEQTYSSPALIKDAQWPAFAALVGKQATEQKVDTAKVAAALTKDAAPYGTGPAYAFNQAGDLLVQFPSGAVADDATTVVLEKKTFGRMLSALGTQAQKAATNPTQFTGTTSAKPDPELVSKPEDKPEPHPTDDPNAEKPTPDEPGDGASPAPKKKALRPSTAVGPDCRVLKCVSLTYDDGPGGRSLELLEVIKKHKATGTFFQMGNSISVHPDMTRKMAAAGMEIGSHTVTHPNLAAVSNDKVQREVAGNSELIKKHTGVTPIVFRPPYGSHNQSVAKVIGDNGMSVIQWEIDSQDWQNRNAAKTTQLVLTAKNYTSPIALQHDIHDASIDSAEGIYTGLEQQGKVLVSVTEMSLNSGGTKAGRAYCRNTALPQEGFNCKG